MLISTNASGFAMSKVPLFFLLMLNIALLSGCSSVGYYWQAVNGHLEIVNNTQPIENILKRVQNTDNRLFEQLTLAMQIRQFAVDQLALPNNGSYTHYVDIKRKYPVWVVSVAPVDSLSLKRWCYLFFFCVSYKGYYFLASAEKEADLWRNKNYEVSVSGVPAYSTLGFTKDPVLSSFIHYPAGELARLIFHELAHQVMYVSDDTAFNESFATAVQEIGLKAWFANKDNSQHQKNYINYDRKRKQLFELLLNTKDKLATVYGSQATQQAKLIRKAQIFSEAKAQYQELKSEHWNGSTRYDVYFQRSLNNASMGLLGVYNNHVESFKNLFRTCKNDYALFYHVVNRLAKKEKAKRDQLLLQLAAGNVTSSELECRQ